MNNLKYSNFYFKANFVFLSDTGLLALHINFFFPNKYLQLTFLFIKHIETEWGN